MKVIILAAGRGSRLGERTKDRPKCMCTLQGRTLLDRCLESLEQAGVSKGDTGIVTGYRSDMFHVPGVTYFHNEVWEQTNMFYSLTMAEEWLKREPCIVCYSDIVFSPRAVQALADSTAPLAITSYSGYWELWEKRMENPLEDLETFQADGEGRLLEIGKKPKSREEVQGQFMGLLRFTPESWSWVEKTVREPLAKPVNKLDMTTLLQELLQRGYPVQTISTGELWLECDSEQDIEAYEKYFGELL
ncbi:MAG: phosphocholine cytidylyltransferase family protein [Bacilli bacterium]|nr:phosphocholine cytidylyltransferase family protein [Bacilli bacterium]